jgi:protein-tyrosine kinase
MSESIGLIERAASLLQREASPQASPSAEAADAEEGASSGLILDTRQLARHGIRMPTEGRSKSVEEFRLIKRNLMNAWSQDGAAADQPPGRLIMITSARPGEGKSFVAINLALAFACETDIHVLLVDIDTNHPMLPTFFGVAGEKGLVDVLAGDLRLPDVLVRTTLPKLAILPSGQGGPHVPELLSSKPMSALLADMTSRYPDRVIIIDTPPCLASSDAATLAPLVGQIVFVVEAHRTHQQEIESGLGQLGGCPRISLLLNKCDGSVDHFGAYGYYNYYERQDRIGYAQSADEKS